MKKTTICYLSALAVAGVMTATAAVYRAVPEGDASLEGVSNLTGTVTVDGVVLNWDSPVDGFNDIAVTESFEDYESGASDIAPWTIVDEDGLLAAANPPGLSGITGKPTAWNVTSYVSGTFKGPRTGTKMLVTTYYKDQTAPASDWLISPELNGRAQTITLYARSFSSARMDAFEVLYSTTDKELSSFEVAASFTDVPYYRAYTRYTASLPEGARYFAIRSTAVYGYTLQLDDITYIPASKALVKAVARAEGDEAAVCTGFNVYRDGEKVNDTPLTVTHLTDGNVGIGTYTYTVTAVYGDSESAPCDPVEVTVSADNVYCPAPENLRASLSNDGITLNWDDPDTEYHANTTRWTETFDDCSSGTTDVFPIDVNVGLLKGWTLIDNSGATPSTGANMFGFHIYSYGVDNTNALVSSALSGGVDNDAWAVSPELNGQAQTIEFMMRSYTGYEGRMDIYYSMGNDPEDVASFVKINENPIVSTVTAYKSYSADIPLGAKRFAFHCINPGGTTYCRLDNISYIPEVYPAVESEEEEESAEPASAPRRINNPLLGYNLYRNGEKVNDEPMTEQTYFDNQFTPGTTSTYTVTAVYGAGESAQSAEVSVEVPLDPAPRKLGALLTQSGVSLKWVAPEMVYANTEAWMETFDSYEAGNVPFDKVNDTTAKLGPWTCVARAQGSRTGLYAFYIQTSSGVDGTGCLTNYPLAAASDEEDDPDNDDWLISERLTAHSQTISLDAWASSNHNVCFEMLYTTSDDALDLDSYVVVDRSRGLPYMTNNKGVTYNFDVPMGATYFALHCITESTGYLRFDNIVYVPENKRAAEPASAPSRVIADFQGYNVYRNGVRINEALITSSEWLDEKPIPGQTAEYLVKGVYGADESAPSNTVTVDVPADPVPEVADTEIVADGILLTWNEVNNALPVAGAMTEDFESYYTCMQDHIGDWTTVAVNDVSTITTTPGQAYSGMSGFYVTKSGYGHGEGTNRAGYGMASNAPAGEGLTVDDWLITPELSGVAQTVTLWAHKNAADDEDQMEIYISSTDKDLASFTLLTAVEDLSKTWTEMSFDLPEGTLYMAVRHISTTTTGVLYVDDVTYAPSPWGPTQARAIRQHTGYNVYCNGELLNSEPLTGTSYIHVPGSTGHFEYAVTSVYQYSESDPSVVAAIDVKDEMVVMPVIDTLDGSASDADVTLTWERPDTTGDPVYQTEGFESYAAGATSIAPWILVNAREASHTNTTQDMAAYFVDDTNTHSGSRSMRTDRMYGGNDDWLISPRLCGLAQTVTLWACSKDQFTSEKFQLMCSYTDREIESFEEVGEVTKVTGTSWNQYTFELPAGARYFAVRCVSIGGFGFRVDDITFATECTFSGTLMGYNVYRLTTPLSQGAPSTALEGYTKVNESPLSAPTFGETVGDGTHTYVVTSIFPWGESEPSNAISIEVNTTGVEAVKIGAASADAEYYNLQGVRVVRPVAGQVYIVRRGAETFKQLVR